MRCLDEALRRTSDISRLSLRTGGVAFQLGADGLDRQRRKLILIRCVSVINWAWVAKLTRPDKPAAPYFHAERTHHTCLLTAAGFGLSGFTD